MHHPSIKHNPVQHHKSEGKQTYYWIVGRSNDSGRGMIFGYKMSQPDAEEAINKIHNASCEIIKSHTNDEDKFSRELRGKVLMDTGDIDYSYRKFNHQQRV